VVRDWRGRYGIAAEHVWDHKVIDPTRRKDPRNFNHADFVAWAEPNDDPMPNNEQGTPAVLANKSRWWMEEMQRQYEVGNLARAQAIRLSLIALLYRLEQALA
jgi:hypothetical protein